MRVLVARAGALGDLVLLGPALWDLRAAGWEALLLAPARHAAPLLASGLVADLLDWESPDLGALLAGHPSAAWAEQLSACQAAVVFSQSIELRDLLSGSLSRVLVRPPQPRHGTHAAEWFRKAVTALGARPVRPTPVWTTAALEPPTALILERLGGPGFVSVHPGSGSPRKNWPAERFVSVARRLSAERPWLYVSGPVEAAGQVPQGACPARELPLGQLAALLSRAGLHLGNDAGVSHLAAAVGAPTLALFGPTDPAAWAPVGPRTSTLRAPGGGLLRLDEETVLAAALRLRSEAPGLPCG